MARRRSRDLRDCDVIGACSFCEEECMLDNAKPLIELINCPRCGLYAQAWEIDQGPWTLEGDKEVHAVHVLFCGDCEYMWITVEVIKTVPVEHLVLEIEI